MSVYYCRVLCTVCRHVEHIGWTAAAFDVSTYIIITVRQLQVLQLVFLH